MGSRKEEAVEIIQLIVPVEREPGEEGPRWEWVWAQPLGSGRYRLESAPFFAYGLSCGDIVRAAPGAPGELPEISELERKAGGRTLRLAFGGAWETSRPEVLAVLEQFVELGCSYEALPPKRVTLSIPEEVDVAVVVERLQKPSRDGLLSWEWADPRPS